MATESLGLKTYPETKLYRAAAFIMKSDETLNRVVKTWGTWDASNRDTESRLITTKPTANMLPLIRLRPVPEVNSPATMNQTINTMRIDIEAYTNGLDGDDILNLWGAIRESWMHSRKLVVDGDETTVQCYLAKVAKCTIPRIIRPSYNAFSSRDKVIQYLGGIGSVEIDFMLNH